MKKEKSQLTNKIIAKALDLGFGACGISRAEFLEEDAPRLEKWLRNGFHGEMKYMENHFDKRLDPRLLVDGAQSVISVLYNYYTPDKQVDDAPVISKYAYGKDYHFVLKDKLNLLFDFIKQEAGEVNGRVYVDSAPVLDKVWAVKSGLGWIGKNGNLITKQTGSFYFIGELIIDLELEYSSIPSPDYCGKCTRCIDACPTKAIISPRNIDARKCISYLTIEYKGKLPAEYQSKMSNSMFGCDICQNVCPYNNKALPHSELQFDPHPELLKMTSDEWRNLSPEKFSELFKKTAVKRSNYKGIKRNIDFLLLE